MKKIYLLAVSLLSGSMLLAQPYNVTFQVDMNNESVSANGVHVAGDFQAAAGASGNWVPGETELTDANNDGIYDVTVSIPAGRYEYKFINDNDWPGAENVPAIAQVEEGNGNNNRYLWISSDTNLPAIVFAGAAPDGMKFVKLKADFRNQLTMTSTPDAMGEFNGWSDHVNLYDPEMDSIYYNFVYWGGPDTMEYKFRNTHDWGDSESIGDPACTSAGGNRVIDATSDVISDANCYSACGPCVAPAATDTINVTIQVDMAYENTCSEFDTVDVTGAGATFGNWGENPLFFTDANNDDIWEVTVQLLTNTSYEFKFRTRNNGNVKWESSANRIFMTAVNADVTLDPVCFEQTVSCAASGPAPFGPATVTFAVDMANETPDSVIYVMGAFTDPQWQAGALELEYSGEGSVFVAQGEVCSNTFAYKFVNGDINTPTNEEFSGDTAALACNTTNGIGGYNRTHTRTAAGDFTLAYFFSTCDEFAYTPNGIEENGANMNLSVFPNPFKNSFTVVSNSASPIASVTVTDLSGRTIAQIAGANRNSIDVSASEFNMVSGLYLVNIVSENGSHSVVKVSAL